MAFNAYSGTKQIITGHPQDKLAVEFDDNGGFQNVASESFPFDEVDRNLGFSEPDEQPERGVSMSDVGAALSLIIQWICSADTLTGAGARAAALLTYLDPVNSKFSSLSEIARAAGITRASLSKSLLGLRDGAGSRHQSVHGQTRQPRQAYSDAQREAVAKGTHCSATRKDSVR